MEDEKSLKQRTSKDIQQVFGALGEALTHSGSADKIPVGQRIALVKDGATYYGPLKEQIAKGKGLIIDGPNGCTTSIVIDWRPDPDNSGYMLVKTENSIYRLAPKIADDFSA